MKFSKWFDTEGPNVATVAEFKGPDVYGVVWIVQISNDISRIEAHFSGLSEGAHGWSINEYGDLTRGAATTGGIYNPETTAQFLEVSCYLSFPVSFLGKTLPQNAS